MSVMDAIMNAKTKVFVLTVVLALFLTATAISGATAAERVSGNIKSVDILQDVLEVHVEKKETLLYDLNIKIVYFNKTGAPDVDQLLNSFIVVTAYQDVRGKTSIFQCLCVPDIGPHSEGRGLDLFGSVKAEDSKVSIESEKRIVVVRQGDQAFTVMEMDVPYIVMKVRVRSMFPLVDEVGLMGQGLDQSTVGLALYDSRFPLTVCVDVRMWRDEATSRLTVVTL